MDFHQRVADLSNRSKHASSHALTEEATKTSVILPLIQSLGFDVFNLQEVIPEFIADVGIKKGEKIDFAVKIDGKVVILIEVKPISQSLGSAQYSQLYRYFAVVDARLAILTNGREIWFFSDIDEKNKMDKRPFFVFDLQKYDENQVKELARFQKSEFEIESILEAASSLKYVKAAANLLVEQMAKPDDDFVRYVGKHIYEGSLTKGVVEQLRPVIQAALDEVVRNRIQERLNVTFSGDGGQGDTSSKRTPDEASKECDVVTTDDEMQAFMIVRAIAAKILPVERITIRDAKTYCSVFVDDNNRKPVCRFYFNGKTPSIGVFDAAKQEVKHTISTLADIYGYEEQIRSAIAAYI